jgi:hypothetical protein
MRYGIGLAALVACVGTAAAEDTIDQLMDRFHVDELWVTTVEQTDLGEGERVLHFNLGDQAVNVPIHDHNVRAQNFIWRHATDEGFVDVEAPAPTTFRGTVEGMPASIVAGGFIDGKPTMTIFLEGPEAGTWGVEPAGDGSGRHVAFRTEASNLEGYCLTVDPEGINGAQVAQAQDLGGDTGSAPVPRGTPRVVEIGLEGDFSFLQDSNNNPNTAQSRLDTYVNTANVVYERDVNLTFQVTGSVIRFNSSQDPYTSTQAGTRLSQVRSQWSGPLSDIPHDAAYTFTGVNLLDGSSTGVLGIAYLAGICTDNGVGLTEGRFSSSTVSLIFIHEAGHNWNAVHCDGTNPCRIMCAGFGGCSGFGNPSRFAQTSINRINNYAQNRSCIDSVEIPFPITDNFASTSFNADLWPAISGASIESVTGAPSAPNAVRMDGSDTLESTGFTYSVSRGVQFSHRAVTEAGVGDVVVEYFNNNEYRLMGRVPASSSGDGFEQVTLPMPPDGRAVGVEVRFRGTNGAAVHLDDITFGTFQNGSLSTEIPFTEGFELGALPLERWVRQDDAGFVADATAPEGSSVLSLADGDLLVTSGFTGLEAQDLIVGAFVKGVGAFDSLGVEYLDAGGTWQFVDFILGQDASDWVLFEATIPVLALHSDLQVRFVPSSLGEDWLLDDVQISHESREGGDACPADYNEDGNVNVLDVVAFITLWNTAGEGADYNGDGNVNVLDVVSFITVWNNGCP